MGKNDVMSFALNIIRMMLFFIAEACLKLMDIVYGIITEIVNLNLGDFDFIWNWWTGISALLFLFIVMRLFIKYFQSIYDEEVLEKVKVTELLMRLVAVAFIMVILPVGIKGLSSISSNLASNFSTVVGITNSQPSAILMENSVNPIAGDRDKTPSIVLSKINEKIGDSYVYFPTSFDIIFILGASVLGSGILIFIAIQMSQRMIGLLLKILVSPYSLSGIVDAGDTSVGTWFKLCIADFLSTFFQMALLLLVLTVISTLKLNSFAKTIFFIGALLAVMNSPTGVAQLLGGDIGAGTAFQQMQSLQMLTSGISTAGKLAGTAVGAGVAGAVMAGAGATYGLGRAIGGNSLAGMAQSAGAGVAGMAGMAQGASDSGGQGSSGSAGESGATYNAGSPQGSGDSGGYAKEGSFASNFSTMSNVLRASSSKGIRAVGKLGRVTSIAARSMYKASGSKLNQSSMVQNTRKVRNAVAKGAEAIKNA